MTKEAQKNAKQALDQFETHFQHWMPDTAEYEITVQAHQDHDYGPHGIEIEYTLEETIETKADKPESSFTFAASGHIINGSSSEIKAEYEALIDELTTRFEYREINEPDLDQILEGEEECGL